MKKHCEFPFCGRLTDTAFYRFVAKVAAATKLDSPGIRSLDEKKQLIVFSNGTKLEYHLIMKDIVITLRTSPRPHIFCSEECVNKVMDPSSWFCWVVDPDVIETQNSVCEQCGVDFPNTDKTCIVSPLRNIQVSDGRLGQPPAPGKWDVILSDINDAHPIGKWYGYSVDSRVEKSLTLCSNECSYEYARTHLRVPSSHCFVRVVFCAARTRS